MAVCFFNGDDSVTYKCDYVIAEGIIKITVDYDIGEEIEDENHMRIWAENISFPTRDIFIIDGDSRKYYLVKDASYGGGHSTYRLYESIEKTVFISNFFFENSKIDKLLALKHTPKVSGFRVYSDCLLDYIGIPSLKIKNDDDCYGFLLSKKTDTYKIDVDSNNIKRISIGDSWYSNKSTNRIEVNLEGFINVELNKRVNYTDMQIYIFELILYMQLYIPEHFSISKIYAEVDGEKHIIHVPIRDINYVSKMVRCSVEDDLLIFLHKCYLKLAYRKCQSDVHNISNVVINKSTDIENCYLDYYKFIESHYKRRNVPRFMSVCFEEHFYDDKDELEKNKMINEMIALRNHYVHSGYSFKNNKLKISKPRNGIEMEPYTVMVSFDWIYERTKILYNMALDIIFKELLGYDKYEFNRTF